MKLYVCCLTLLTLLSLPRNSYSTTMMEESPEAIIARAEYVVSASVIDITGRLEDNKPFEYITLKLKEVHKQDASFPVYIDDEITIKLLGGEVADKKLDVDGRPTFVKDEEVFVSLNLGDNGFFYVVGNVQGLYHAAGSKLVNDTAETNAMFVRKGETGEMKFAVPASDQKTMKEMKAIIEKVAEEE